MDKREMGRLSRQRGSIFERKTINHFRDLGYIVTRFNGNIDLDKQEVVSSKPNPFRRNTLGFPDIVVMGNQLPPFFVECKTNNILSKQERLKLQFLENKGFRTYTAFNDDGKLNLRRMAT